MALNSFEFGDPPAVADFFAHGAAFDRGTGPSPPIFFYAADELVPLALRPGSNVIFLPRLPLSALCSGMSGEWGPRRGKRAARAGPRTRAGDELRAA